MAHDPDRQPSDKLRLEAKLYEIGGLGMPENLLGCFQRPLFGSEANRRLPQALTDNFFQTAEGAAYNEQNVLGIDGRRGFAAALREIHHRLNLARKIIG